MGATSLWHPHLSEFTLATYQALVAPSCSSAANYLAWAQALGKGFNNAGWSPQTGHGEVVASGSGTSYAWTNVVAASLTRHQPQTSYNFRGAFVAGTTYTGISTTAAQANVDLVTYNGLTYAHLTASSNLSTTPDLDTTNWAVLNFEIWKSNGPMSSTLPIYVRIAYCANGNATPYPCFHIAIGTAIDASGNINQNGIPISASSPTTNWIYANGTSQAGSTALSEIDVSGDADNIRFILWRGDTSNSGNRNSVWVIDRAKTSTGADSDAFFYVGWVGVTNGETGGSQAAKSFVVAKSTLGGGIVATNPGVWLGTLLTAIGATLFGTTPPNPIFPPFGWLANPLLGVIAYDPANVTDGAIQYAWMYGAAHPYLVNNNNSAIAARNVTGYASNACVAIRWE